MSQNARPPKAGAAGRTGAPGKAAAPAGGPKRDAGAAAVAKKAAAKKPGASPAKCPSAPKKRSRVWPALITLAVVCLVIDAIVLISWPKKEEVQVVTAYVDEIRASAAEWDLDPAYVASVVMAESSYRPDAVSSVNAQGLMQIVPETGDWIAGRLGETYVEGQLLDPATNLRYGCWYLKWLMDRYGNDMATASAAYFQGQGVVDRWLTDPLLSQDRKKLTDFGTENTKQYVERILKYYEKYSGIYAQA